MNALPIVVGTLCIFAIAYRYYSAFLASKVAVLDDSRPTPAYTQYDGNNYVPTSKWVLFGHHFAAITGAGPLIGPVLATQFGFLPGLLWIVIGVVVGGAVHDFIILAASTRRGGKSLAEIAKMEINPLAGTIAALAILFIVVIALAGLGLAVIHALSNSPWGTFTIGMTIPLALVMGLYMFHFRQGKIAQGTAFGVVGLILAVVLGRYIPGSSLAPYFTLSKVQLTFLLAAYGFLASVLPVWLLLSPRDYLSSFMKIGTIGFLTLGILIVHPDLKMPALSSFVNGGGPIVPGKLFPFVFITIACGAISGFHSLISSGTTPKMISLESHARTIGYGAMLIEAFVGITSLIAAASLFPGDYFAINVPPERLSALGIQPVNLPALNQMVGEELAGRTGGAVSLAVGMAQIFSGLPGMRHLMAYWYHFAIMFEALFILTTIDAGTRVARFVLQEFAGKFYRPLERADSIPGTLLSSLAIVGAWTYLILTGSISTIWPMFGIANQLLASIALCVGTTVIINSARERYAWVTLIPMLFVMTTTMTAGWKSITDIFIPLISKPGSEIQGIMNTILTGFMMVCVVVILIDAIQKWIRTLGARQRPTPWVERQPIQPEAGL